MSAWLADAPIKVTDSDIFDLYRRAGNPHFDPATGADDNGVDMTVMLSAAIQGGIGGHKPVAFALIDGTDPEEIRAAGAIFGCTLWGADLATAQQTQTVWDYLDQSPAWGGHAIAAAGRYTDTSAATQNRTGLISWAQLRDSTDGFIAKQVPERYAVIWPWHLGTKAFQQGIDEFTLATDYQAFTGRQFPIAPTPTPPIPAPPGPTPEPPAPPPVSAADRALANAIPAAWLHHPLFHPVEAEVAAAAVREWLTATGQSAGGH
ncbi:MAG: hypothetical protein ACRDQX_10750 [Pseudonocardiaceae bacterium]